MCEIKLGNHLTSLCNKIVLVIILCKWYKTAGKTSVQEVDGEITISCF